jgi:ADP-ribosylglycohydrolase
MDDKRKALVLASFAADSLALGVHWIYDIQKIASAFGRVDQLLDPSPNSYHSSKSKGEFTHYGDQAMVLLRSVSETKGFSLEDFSKQWQHLFKDYNGYIDQATRMTLTNFKLGSSPHDAGSGSLDFSAAVRIAPLVFSYQNDLDSLVQSAKSQAAMTHNNPQVIEAAEFFARVTWQVLKGDEPVGALMEIAEKQYKNGQINRWVMDGYNSREKESVSAIVAFGQSCNVNDAFPGAVHLICKYQDNLQEALVQAVMAGGDSSARGMAVGMVLGAFLGTSAIPENWLSDLKQRQTIENCLNLLE